MHDLSFAYHNKPHAMHYTFLIHTCKRYVRSCKWGSTESEPPMWAGITGVAATDLAEAEVSSQRLFGLEREASRSVGTPA